MRSLTSNGMVLRRRYEQVVPLRRVLVPDGRAGQQRAHPLGVQPRAAHGLQRAHDPRRRAALHCALLQHAQQLAHQLTF